MKTFKKTASKADLSQTILMELLKFGKIINQTQYQRKIRRVDENLTNLFIYF